MSATKKIDSKYAKHLVNLLEPIQRERFDDNQTAFARAVGVSQSQLSALMKRGGGERSVGINVLLRLRDYLDMSIDDLLGLPPLRSARTRVAPQPGATNEQLVAAVEAALVRLKQAPELPVPPSMEPKRKRVTE